MKRRVVYAFLIAIFSCSLNYFTSSAAAPEHITLQPSPRIQPIATPRPSRQPASQATPQPQPIVQTVVTTRTSPPTTQGNSLSIPSIGFRAPIINVGLTTGGAIDVPSGRQVGRWTGSATPGSPGAVFLDGHVDGVFAKLSNLSIGQLVSVVYDSQLYQYRVVHREIVDLATIDMRRALSVLDGTEGLNMMTCAGTFIPSQGTYDQRLVIYTVRI